MDFVKYEGVIMIMKLSVLCLMCAVGGVLAQGPFQNNYTPYSQQPPQPQQPPQQQNFVSEPTRQLSSTQQSHILSDIQQHQHRFAQYQQQIQQQQLPNQQQIPLHQQQLPVNVRQQQQFPSLQQHGINNNQQLPQLHHQQLPAVTNNHIAPSLRQPILNPSLPQSPQLLTNEQFHVHNNKPQSPPPVQITPSQQVLFPSGPGLNQYSQQQHDQQSQNSFHANVPSLQNPVVHQHHTQTAFTPNYVQQQQQLLLQQQQRQLLLQQQQVGDRQRDRQQQGPIQQGPIPQRNNQQHDFHQHQQQINNNQQQYRVQPKPTQSQRIAPSQVPTTPSRVPPLQQSLPTNVPLQSLQQHVGQHSEQGAVFTPDQALQFQQQQYLELQRQQQRAKELREKQLIIQKHEQFVAKQQQKQLQKVRQLHQEFVEKELKKPLHNLQTQIPEELVPVPTASAAERIKSRPLQTNDVPLFQQALKIYNDLHPTTTTTTTTVKPSTTRQPPSTTTTAKPRPSKITRAPKQQRATASSIQSRIKTREQSQDPDVFLDNPRKIHVTLPNKQNIQQDGAARESTEKVVRQKTPTKLYEREDLLKQLKLAIGDNPTGGSLEPKEVVLPNGQRVQVIPTTDPKLLQGAIPLSGATDITKIKTQSTTVKPTREIFEELTKGVLPPGAEYQLIRQGGDGKLEEVGALPQNIPNKKAVTFVVLEEQEDGSFKVQGVRGNGDKKELTSGPEYEAVLKRIKDGEIQLPAGARPSTTPASSTTTTTTVKPTTYRNKYSTPSRKTENTRVTTTSTRRDEDSDVVSIVPPERTYRAPIFRPNPQLVQTTAAASTEAPLTARKDFLPTVSSSTIDPSPYSTIPTVAQSTSRSTNYYDVSTRVSSTLRPPANQRTSSSSDDYVRETASSTSNTKHRLPELTDVLKNEGLHAMSRYLKQSGLDMILNETGPYTVFAPTDKAFKNLLVQLGGPEKAEEKFKSNPRLLSGLLLHHIIPGAFEIESLQDEMTGVSLAGTQLRVNQYPMHDNNWNDVKVTTINGARIVSEKQDIGIPQGIAHALDQVMFPLPVGDIVQTLQTDREHRFTHFIRALYASGMADTLSGTKTFTVFAPTDAAFSAAYEPEELQRAVTDAAEAKDLVTRHVSAGALYSSGMRYYQVRDSLAEGRAITLQRNGGRIKVNEGHVLSTNIPATNGVIHAVDSLL